MSVAIKIKETENSNQTISEVLALLRGVCSGEENWNIGYDPKISKEELREKIETEFPGCTTRSGVSGGCYGARDGKSYEGITVFMNLENFAERWIDSDGDEIVNPIHLFNKHGERQNLDPDTLLDTARILGHNIWADNTYNFVGKNEEYPSFLCGFQFHQIDTENGEVFVFVCFHGDGDPRGNYGSTAVYKFHNFEDFNCVIFPTSLLKGE